MDARVNGVLGRFELMAKYIPMLQAREVWVLQGNTFQKEVTAYTKILPAFQKLLKEGMELGIPKFLFGGEKVNSWSWIVEKDDKNQHPNST